MATTTVNLRLVTTAARGPVLWYVLTAGVVATIATWAFRFGYQPVFGDAQGYYDLARGLVTDGPAGFASEVRTYGYPAFLALIMLIVGPNPDELQLAVCVAQVLILVGAAWIGARRIEQALSVGGISGAIFFWTAANPFPLLHSVQLLTDLLAAVLVYLAVVLSLPSRHRAPGGRVLLLAGLAFLCASLAVMMRPANLVVAPILVGIWIARGVLFRDVPRLAVVPIVVAFVLPFLPQAWSNVQAYGVAQPLIVKDLYAAQGAWGLQYAKYGTIAITGVPSRLYYDNPFRPPVELTPGQVLRERPGSLLATFAVHAFALIDQDFPFTYIRDPNPRYRWPLSIFDYLFFLGASVGLVVGLRGTPDQSDAARRRQRFTLLALAAVAAALVALYLPTAVESRFSLPLYLLLATPVALAVRFLFQAVPTAGVLRLALGTLVAVVWVGASAAASIWIQDQAPLLAQVRAAQAGPLPETPAATYDTNPPGDLVVDAVSEVSVTVTNVGHQTWDTGGFHPVEVAARFIPLKSDLYKSVKGRMKDSQAVPLPADVPPGGTATVTLKFQAPPEPGRYTLHIHVTRLGVPDPDTAFERIVRVSRER